jgi:hypothetical protein
MRRRTRDVVFFLVTALAFGSILSVATPAAPTARAATTLEVCGTVNAYVKPTALLAGAITIGGTPWEIAAGASATGDIEAGAHLCLRLTLNSNGTITDLVAVKADASSSLRICGEVTAYTEATALATGRLTIGPRTLTVAAGADLPASVHVGADICADFELNGFGQIRDGDITANSTSTLKLCGDVTAFAEATPTSTGGLTIGGRHFVLAMGADLPGAVEVGAEGERLRGGDRYQDGQPLDR